MDLDVELKYGTEKVVLPIRGARSIEYINGSTMPELENLEQALYQAIEQETIGCGPLREQISADDMVTIVVSDITRCWMKQGRILDILGPYLHEKMGIPHENITILVALGTHRASSEAELKVIAGDYMYEHCRVVQHDCDAECTYIGTTAHGTRVEVNPLIVGRKVIVVAGTVHHMMAGFGGGRKSILPGVSSRETIRQNHCRSMHPFEAHSNPKSNCSLLEDNPVNEDMNEAAALAEVAFSINIVMSTNGKHSAFFCGKLHEAWLESCMYQRRNYEKPIDYQADVVVLSSGGAPKDMNLYQGFKALKNAVNCVKEGGEAIWLCKCPEGCGAPDYSSWLQPLLEGHLDESLRKEFTIGGFIFYLTVESLGQIKCRIMSEMGNDIVQPMGAVGSYKSMEALLEGVDFTGKTVYVMPQAGNVLPMYKKD